MYSRFFWYPECGSILIIRMMIKFRHKFRYSFKKIDLSPSSEINTRRKPSSVK